ncbi:MAG TPA: aminoglycoside phosphotransferase family protein [Desulfosporosinus sp.]|nr:aminoglycoside phosphotransferase family protein [Desulfosporosinus sp.]
MLYEQLLQHIAEYVNSKRFKRSMNLQGRVEVKFLAQGEYNLNYLLETAEMNYVFRINTASQMNLLNQINYEYQTLELLKHSGVTPKPYYLDDSKNDIPYGVLVMEYLPGEPLNYRTDLTQAAVTFAKIHNVPSLKDEIDYLVKVDGSFSAIYQEAQNLLTCYFDCPEANPQVKKLLETVLLHAEEKKKEEIFFQKEPWRAVINTEVNSHNFIVNNDLQSCHLIDWEKPIYGEPAQDLSMFLIATTTLWKRNYVLSREQEEQFLRSYVKELPPCPHIKTLTERVESFKFFNTLRAVSWCAMAWTEYTKPGRVLVNGDTFEKIEMYIETGFIKSCFPTAFKRDG